MTNKDLISQYVDTGIGIPRYQFDKLSNNDKKTYLRKMEISVDYDYNNLKYYYGELPEAKQIDLVKQASYLIQHIQNPSEAVQLAAVNKYGHAIQHIQNPSEAVQMIVVNEHPNMIQHIKTPSEQVQLRVIRENPYAIEYIETPTENTQLEAIKNTNGRVIKYIKNLTDKAIELSKRYNL